MAEPDLLEERIAALLRQHRPGVVVTMDPTGSDGHRDHVAVAQATTRAFETTVDWPASLYHWCLPHSLMDAWAREMAALEPGSVYLGTELGRPDEEVTTVIDGADVREQVREAMSCHLTQTGLDRIKEAWDPAGAFRFSYSAQPVGPRSVEEPVVLQPHPGDVLP